MSEQDKDVNKQDKQEAGSAGTPAEAKNTDSPMIPKERFDEINNQRKELEAKLLQIEADQKSRIEKQLEEQGKFKELNENLRAELAETKLKAEKAGELEGTLEKLLAAQLEALPEQTRQLVPEKLSIQDRLDYIATNRDLLVKPAAPNTGAGVKGAKHPDGGVKLSNEQLQMAAKMKIPPDEYAKYVKESQ